MSCHSFLLLPEWSQLTIHIFTLVLEQVGRQLIDFWCFEWS